VALGRAASVLTNLRGFLGSQRILLLVCLIILVNQIGFGLIVPVTPIYAQSFGVDEAAIGLVVAVYGLGRFLFSAAVGQAADRLGRKRVILIGTVVTCVGSLLCGLAGSYLQLLLFRFISGIGSTAVITGTQIVVADLATPDNRGRMMSTYSGFFQFAVGIGPSIGGVIAVLWGPRAPFFVFAVLTLIAGAIAQTQLPDTRVKQQKELAGNVTALGGRSAIRLLLANVAFLTICLIDLTAAFNRTGAIFSVVPLMGHDKLGLNAAQIGLALTIGNLCNLGIVGFTGVLVDRYGRKPVIIPSCVISALAFAGFAYVAGYPAFVFSAILWGIGVAGAGSASAAYAADQAPPGANGITMGIYRTLSDFGYVVGPALLGLIAQVAGSQTSLLISAVLALAALIPFALFAPETGGRHLRAAPRPAKGM
jgi:multidrug resistance protein